MKQKITLQKLLASTITGLFLTALCSVGASEQALPEPGYDSSLPFAENWGGDALPPMKGLPAEGAPAISAISEITLPGETLVMTGAGLEKANLAIWAEGEFREVEPLFAHDDRLAAIVPDEMAKSLLLVWPVRDGNYGAPIRVNAATAWWCWPRTFAENADKNDFRVMGKNLQVEAGKPFAYISGEGVSEFAKVSAANPYQLEVELPALGAGKYQVWTHNGTGGVYGWSEPLDFEVTKTAPDLADVRIEVGEHGAIPNDGKDDHAALSQAVAAAAEAGGGTIAFPAGEFHLSKTLEITSEYVRLVGAGAPTQAPNEDPAVGGDTATRLSPLENRPVSGELIKVVAPNVTLEAMGISNAHDGNDQNVVGIYRPNAVLRNLQISMLDYRDWGYPEPGPWTSADAERRGPPYATGIIDSGAVMVDTEGTANLLFADSDVHATGPGIQIGRFSGWGTSVSRLASESIWIENVNFRGHYAGEPDGKTNPGASGRATGVVVYSGRQIGVKNSTFAGADRENRRIMGRTVLVFNTSARNMYFGENRSTNVGPHPSAIGIDPNQGEQYLIHYRYPHGGLFRAVRADNQTLTVTTSDIEPFPAKKDPTSRWDLRDPHFHFDTRGGQILPEVNQGGNWIVFISQGKGAGQFREVQSFEKNDQEYTFALDRSWRVLPDETSRVNLMPAYRHVAIYKNTVDTGSLVKNLKTHGVTFWFDSFDNVVASNTFKNLTSGIIFNSRFRGPTGWNSTRDNVVENIYGDPGDTSEKAAGYVDHTRLVVQWPKLEDRVWYQVGNVARHNTIRNAEVGMYLHTRYTGLVRTKKPPTVPHAGGGMVLSVLEHNTLENVGEGIVMSSPVNAAVVRDNQVGLAPGASGPIVVNQDAEGEIIDSVIVDNRDLSQPVPQVDTVKDEAKK